MPLLLARTPPSSLSPFPLQNARAPLITASQKRFPLAATRIVLFTSRRSILASPPPKCASINGVSVPNNPEASGEEQQQVYNASELLERIRKWVGILPSILPGGRWWEFSGDVDVQVVAQPVTVWRALGKMWDLVAGDRWVIFAAFSALIVAAISEISIPHLLTASIFSAQSADLTVYHRNVRLLVLLCVASGICSGIRGCFFGIANMILDISFFDNETVGDLTSRLGADCQQVSRVIGNDLNLIMRNVLQGGGSLIYLLILSWPLGLSTLVVCSILAAVMLRYGRYKWWLEKLADISLRQSAAYGVWNFSFNILYHSTQVIAVLFGGMSILAGHITAEKLTKFILYSEWLIYSTWWVGDNISNLMQSVGASEKVSVVQHVNFVVYPGEVVAIVGLSGSGKSTLVNLLLRLYEPTNGQEPKLFRMDISSNIRYGCTRDVKQEDIEWAAKQAYAHNFISALPNGYETLVDDDLLSGGQKQRIAIARALLRDPKILILDEATSALDAESEHNVKGVLRSVRSDSATRSVIVIAHRLSTIQAADRIVVMDGGHIIEMGSHRELLLKDGLYARLTRKQADAMA
ncbi:hypothetical protein JHK85_003286 [Glycine max]|nr:hypothetical protein JHK85_003286 [Glycine max]KAG5079057.1 hypothetical protein JHK86_003122 [Glycine max]